MGVSFRLIILAIVLGRITGAAAGESAEAQIARIETELGGRLGVVALDTATERRIGHRADERFPMCSTFKLLVAAAVLHRVDEKQDQLSRFIPYTEADLIEYAPVTRKHVGQGGMTLGALCAAALQESDNTAANLLLGALGGPAGFTRYARTLGDAKTRLDRIEPDLNSAPPGDKRDTTTPAAMLGNLRVLLLGDALSGDSRHQLNTWIEGNRTGDKMIRAGVPHGWRVGDKTGRGAHGAVNDVAILRPPGHAPILLAVYFVGSNAPIDRRIAAIARVARLVVDAFIQ